MRQMGLRGASRGDRWLAFLEPSVRDLALDALEQALQLCVPTTTTSCTIATAARNASRTTTAWQRLSSAS